MPKNREVESSEKVYHHDIRADHGAFACYTCGVVAASPEIISAQPCTRLRKGAQVPGKLSLEGCGCRLIPFSADWSVEVWDVIGDRVDESWELITKDGRTIRVEVHQGELHAHDVPKKEDFPLMIGAVTKERLLKEELEKLKMEEALLAELMHYDQLKEQAFTNQFGPSVESYIDATVPSSSDRPPSNLLEGSLANY